MTKHLLNHRYGWPSPFNHNSKGTGWVAGSDALLDPQNNIDKRLYEPVCTTSFKGTVNVRPSMKGELVIASCFTLHWLE